MSSSDIESFIHGIEDVEIPVFLGKSNFYTLDGESFAVRIKSNQNSEVIIKWSSKPPKEISVINQYLSDFIEELRESSSEDIT